MAINISNVKEWWTIKFWKEEWFFKDFDEFAPVFELLLDSNVGFVCTPKSGGFSIFMNDANLKNYDFDNVKKVLEKCLDFKKRFGDRSRLPNNNLIKPKLSSDESDDDGSDEVFEDGFNNEEF